MKKCLEDIFRTEVSHPPVPDAVLAEVIKKRRGSRRNYPPVPPQYSFDSGSSLAGFFYAMPSAVWMLFIRA
jgi:hypothetical protein